jgi:hypothetical protein
MTPLSCDEVRAQIDLYAAGEGDEPARAAIGRHLTRCPGCARAHEEAQQLLGLLDLRFQEPRRLERLRDRIEAEARPRPARARLIRFPRQLAALAAMLLLAVGVLFYDVPLPEGSAWITFAWVTLLGSAACTLLGIAVSSLAKNGRSASATVTPIALVLQFISGVFFQFSQVPTWLQTAASVFPLKWMAQGLRSVFLPDPLLVHEPAHSWELGRVALVLGIWCVLGLLLCARTFRWTDRGDG